MHLAMSLPGEDLLRGLARDVLRQKLVRDQQHGVGGEALDHAHGVGRGAADVALGLHVGGGVDIGDDRHARICLAQQPHIGAGDRLGKAAAGAHVGDEHGLFRIQQLGGLGHEVHAALDDDFLVHHGRLAGELQRIADDVGNAMVDFRRLVIMRQDDRVALLLELVDPPHVRRMHRPLDGGDVVLHLFVEMRGFARDLLRVGKIGHGQHAELLGCGAGGGGRNCLRRSVLAGQSSWRSPGPHAQLCSI